MRGLGIDFGGTKIAGAVVEDGGVVATSRIVVSIETVEQFAAALNAVVSELPVSDWDVIGIGAAGIVDRSGTYVYGPNTGLRNAKLSEIVFAALGQHAIVDNDANAAAFAESRLGAGKSVKEMIMITLGTGLGCGILIDGDIYRGAHGAAGEAGHMLVENDGRECGCGRRGCWEQYASGTALQQLTGLDGRSAVTRARQGDQKCIDALSEVAIWTGRGLGSLVNLLDPALIVIGGGLSDAFDLMVNGINSGMRDVIEALILRPTPDVVVSQLEPDAGAIGAALLAIEAVLD